MLPIRKLLLFGALAHWCPHFMVQAQECATYSNVKSPDHPNRATHPTTQADLIIGIDAQVGKPYAWMDKGTLTGFGLDLTNAVCKAAGVTCDVIPLPSHSIWPSAWTEFGMADNIAEIPGDAFQHQYVHCAAPSYHTVGRQQSIAFSYPITKGEDDTSGYLTMKANLDVQTNLKMGFLLGGPTRAGPASYFLLQKKKFSTTQYFQDAGYSANVMTLLQTGALDALYVDKAMADVWINQNTNLLFLNKETGWSKGMAYGCHPAFGTAVDAMNRGLTAVKADVPQWNALCAKHGQVNCDTIARTFLNKRSDETPDVMTHPTGNAEIILGLAVTTPTIQAGTFNVALIESMCSKANRVCAIVNVPPQAAVPSSYSKYGWQVNSQNYIGLGYYNKWFHCMPMQNTMLLQQSLAYTNTHRTAPKAGFLHNAKTFPAFPADANGRTVGIETGTPEAAYFKAKEGQAFKPKTTTAFASSDALLKAFNDGTIEAAYTTSAVAQAPLAGNADLAFKFDSAAYSPGHAFGCHPQYGDFVTALNTGLTAIRADGTFNAMCTKFNIGNCVAAGVDNIFDNTKTGANPDRATHPNSRADIVIGTEVAFGKFNFLSNGVVGGFDFELTAAVCRTTGATCAMLPIPWEGAWPASFPDFALDTNPKVYGGPAYHASWVHCTSGTLNLQLRQQSMAFTDPYSDKNAEAAGFVVKAGVTFPADAADKHVGLQSGQAEAIYFRSEIGKSFSSSVRVSMFSATEISKALADGRVDAIFLSSTSAQPDITAGNQFLHAKPGFARGVSFNCHPRFGDIVTRINTGLRSVKQTTEYTTMCDKWAIKCDTARTTWDNTKTAAQPDVATHPKDRALITIAAEADFREYNFLTPTGVLGGFDLLLTQAICREGGMVCAFTTAPWGAAWPAKVEKYGIVPWNTAVFAGPGLLDPWYQCTSGTFILHPRQQTTIFTNPYTAQSEELAGFVTADTAFPANAMGKRVGVQGGSAAHTYFANQVQVLFFPAQVIGYPSSDALFAALLAGTVDAVFMEEDDSAEWRANHPTYQSRQSRNDWTRGVGFGCGPGRGDVVTKLNAGLAKVQNTVSWALLCGQFPSVNCECYQNAVWTNAQAAEIMTTRYGITTFAMGVTSPMTATQITALWKSITGTSVIRTATAAYAFIVASTTTTLNAQGVTLDSIKWANTASKALSFAVVLTAAGFAAIGINFNPHVDYKFAMTIEQFTEAGAVVNGVTTMVADLGVTSGVVIWGYTTTERNGMDITRLPNGRVAHIGNGKWQFSFSSVLALAGGVIKPLPPAGAATEVQAQGYMTAKYGVDVFTIAMTKSMSAIRRQVVESSITVTEAVTSVSTKTMFIVATAAETVVEMTRGLSNAATAPAISPHVAAELKVLAWGTGVTRVITTAYTLDAPGFARQGIPFNANWAYVFAVGFERFAAQGANANNLPLIFTVTMQTVSSTLRLFSYTEVNGAGVDAVVVEDATVVRLTETLFQCTVLHTSLIAGVASNTSSPSPSRPPAPSPFPSPSPIRPSPASDDSDDGLWGLFALFALLPLCCCCALAAWFLMKPKPVAYDPVEYPMPMQYVEYPMPVQYSVMPMMESPVYYVEPMLTSTPLMSPDSMAPSFGAPMMYPTIPQQQYIPMAPQMPMMVTQPF